MPQSRRLARAILHAPVLDILAPAEDKSKQRLATSPVRLPSDLQPPPPPPAAPPSPPLAVKQPSDERSEATSGYGTSPSLDVAVLSDPESDSETESLAATADAQSALHSQPTHPDLQHCGQAPDDHAAAHRAPHSALRPRRLPRAPHDRGDPAAVQDARKPQPEREGDAQGHQGAQRRRRGREPLVLRRLPAGDGRADRGGRHGRLLQQEHVQLWVTRDRVPAQAPLLAPGLRTRAVPGGHGLVVGPAARGAEPPARAHSGLWLQARRRCPRVCCLSV